MSDRLEEEFWAKVGGAVELRRSQGYWSSQRARIMERVGAKKPSAVRPEVVLPALAATALVLFFSRYEPTEKRTPSEIGPPPAELLSDLDFFLQLKAAQDMEALGTLEEEEMEAE